MFQRQTYLARTSSLRSLAPRALQIQSSNVFAAQRFAAENNLSEGLLFKTNDNRFCGSGMLGWDGVGDSANRGTKTVRGKGSETVAKRVVPFRSVTLHYNAGFGGFKYQGEELLAVA